MHLVKVSGPLSCFIYKMGNQKFIFFGDDPDKQGINFCENLPNTLKMDNDINLEYINNGNNTYDITSLLYRIFMAEKYKMNRMDFYLEVRHGVKYENFKDSVFANKKGGIQYIFGTFANCFDSNIGKKCMFDNVNFYTTNLSNAYINNGNKEVQSPDYNILALYNRLRENISNNIIDINTLDIFSAANTLTDIFYNTSSSETSGTIRYLNLCINSDDFIILL